MTEHKVSVQRMIALRQYPGFANADLTELAVLADNAVETEFVAGAVVAREGRVPAFHLVIEGEVAMAEQRWGPRDMVGAVEAIAGQPIAAPIIATARTKTLQVSAADFADIVEDNFGLLRKVLLGIARHLHAVRQRRDAPPRVRHARPTAGASLGLVARLVVLRGQLPFTSGRIHALIALAQATREVAFAPGDLVASKGEWAKTCRIILEGSVRSRGLTLGPDDAIGTVEMLAGAVHQADAEAVSAVRVLECPVTAVFDVIEDHTDLGIAMIATLAREVLDRLREPERATVN